ncbi:MAG: type II secretion system secretin GspD [Ramlibacter sp.]|nr:type II secretion system secretin GspD [Ramlibacter sp.]MBX3660731.1 type II secretion system secretin GspD [Ramlibacter sp.]MCW5651982.1 type II secretion system secretin GspD [Ramlibacter sp.]
MKLKPRLAIFSIAACAALAGAPGLLHAQKPGEPITLNFANAEIEAVARTMAAITGRSIVVDPRVKGTMNLNTDKPVTPSAAYNQFLATLRLSGYTVVEAGGLYKVVPEADAKLQGGAVQTGSVASGGSQIVTQIFRLNYETANNMVPILRPLISPNNTINVNPGNNSLVITDYADNLQRLGRIISALDVSNATDVEILPLKHALASDLAPLVMRLIEAGGATGAPAAGQADTSYKTTVVAEPRSNTLVVRAANPARLNLVRSLVERLDQPTSQSAAGNIYVVYLKNADAAKLAVTLRAALSANTGSTAGGVTGGASPITQVANANSAANAATAPIQASAQPSTGGQIQADPATNSLIITAPEPQYRQLRAVIDRLDQRRAQVYVESLIAEVNADKAAEFGIQWQGAVGKNGDKNIGVLGTNFSIGGQNIISLATQAASGTVLPSTGANFGIARNTNGVYVLGFLARFLEANGDGNILSTPNLLTLDNEEAKIVIGQNVPFVTGQYTNNNSSSGSVNPFQTVERKDVGITLRVKPQISENGTVRLQIFQEVSSVQASSINSATGLITNKRSIESNVLVDDGAIVVLGGLLQDEYSGNQEKVPGLGDVPLFGNLFKSEARSRKKTNLMVFLRPVVVRDSQQTESLSLDRYDLMRLKQEAAQPVPSKVVPVNEAPVLPPPPARKAPAAVDPLAGTPARPVAP